MDGIIHRAAESHVDRSIKDPCTFAQTNTIVVVVFALLLACIYIIGVARHAEDNVVGGTVGCAPPQCHGPAKHGLAVERTTILGTVT